MHTRACMCVCVCTISSQFNGYRDRWRVSKDTKSEKGERAKRFSIMTRLFHHALGDAGEHRLPLKTMTGNCAPPWATGPLLSASPTGGANYRNRRLELLLLPLLLLEEEAQTYLARLSKVPCSETPGRISLLQFLDKPIKL